MNRIPTLLVSLFVAALLAAAAFAFSKNDPIQDAKQELQQEAKQEIAATGFSSLFDGKTLTGWEVQPAQGTEGHWSVAGGEMIAENINKEGSDLWTTKKYLDYEMELEYKTPSDYYDTGVYLRGEGHQVQIGISSGLKLDMTACIYAAKDEHDGSGYPIKIEKVPEFNKPNEWNHLRIVLTGKRIQTFLNGEPFVDYVGDQINAEGPIGLQLHTGHHMKIHFRNVKVKERTDSPAK